MTTRKSLTDAPTAESFSAKLSTGELGQLWLVNCVSGKEEGVYVRVCTALLVFLSPNFAASDRLSIAESAIMTFAPQLEMSLVPMLYAELPRSVAAHQGLLYEGGWTLASKKDKDH